MKTRNLMTAATLMAAAAWTLTAIGAPKAPAGPTRVCGGASLDRLPAGVQFELTADLLAELDLKSEELRAPASSDEARPKPPAEVYAPEMLVKPITWANGNQTQVSCVAVRSATAPWGWPRNANWKLKAVHAHTQSTLGTSSGITRASKETVYALSLVSRDNQAFSLQCTAVEIGHSPWDPKHEEITIGAFQHLFGDILRPAVALESDGPICQPYGLVMGSEKS